MSEREGRLTGYLNLEADRVDGNGRVYPRDVLERAVSSMREEFGAFTHGEEAGFRTLPLCRTSHRVEELVLEVSGKVRCTVRVLNTPCGDQITAMARNGARFGFSICGTVNVNESNIVENMDIFNVNISMSPSSDNVAFIENFHMSPQMTSGLLRKKKKLFRKLRIRK